MFYLNTKYMLRIKWKILMWRIVIIFGDLGSCDRASWAKCDRASWAKCEEREKTNKMQYLIVASCSFFLSSYRTVQVTTLMLFHFSVSFFPPFSSSVWSTTTRSRQCSGVVPYHHRGFEGLVDLFINAYEGSVSNRTGFVNPYWHL